MSLWDDLVDVFSPPKRGSVPRQNASISRSAVKKIVADSLKSLCEELDRENLKRDSKLDKAAEHAKTAAKDAAEARAMVERLVETARETFRDVIAELLTPHYRYLEEQLGIKPPEIENANGKPSSSSRRRSVPARKTPPTVSSKKPLPTGANDPDNGECASKTKRRVSQVGQKKTKAPQNKRAVLQKKQAPARSPAKSEGAKPCRKK